MIIGGWERRERERGGGGRGGGGVDQYLLGTYICSAIVESIYCQCSPHIPVVLVLHRTVLLLGLWLSMSVASSPLYC